MKIYDDYINNSIKRKKESLRSLKITIFLAVLALSVFYFIFGAIVKNDQVASEKHFGNAHLVITGDLTKEKIKLLENNVNIEKLGYLSEESPQDIKNSDLKIYISVIDENFSNITKLKLIKGFMPKNENEIVIPLLTAKDLGLNLGDSFSTMDSDNKEHLYKLVGLIDFDLGSWEKESLGYTYGQQAFVKEKANQVAIWYKNIKDTYKITPQIINSMGLDFEKIINANTNELSDINIKFNYLYLSSHFVNSKYIWHDSNSYKYPQIFILGSLLLAIFFVFVIKNIFKVWENTHVREYGLLLSIGARKQDIRALILKRLFKISYLPISLGLLAGLVFSNIILKIMSKYYMLANEGIVSSLENGFKFYFSFFLVLAIILATIFVLVFSSLGPMRKISKLNIIDSMKLYRTENKKNKERRLEASSFLSDFSKINLGQNRGKMIFSAFSISIASLFLCLMLALLGGLKLTIKYDNLDTMENYEYKISYINPNPFPKELIGKLTNNFKYDYINYRSNSFYLAEENSYKDILDEDYFNSFYQNYKDYFGYSELNVNIIGLDNEKYSALASSLGISYEDLKKENSGFVINAFAKNFKLAKRLQETSKVLGEETKNIVVSDYSSIFIKGDNKTENKKFQLNILGYTEDQNILKVPQAKNNISFITSMDTYFKIAKASNQDHTGKITEEIYFNSSPNMSLDNINKILLENLSSRDIETISRETKNNFEYYSNRILYSLFLAIALIATALGLTQSYSATSSMKEARKQEYTLLMITGMDKMYLRKLAIREVNLSIKYILAFSIISLAISLYLGHLAYKVFSPLQIFLNMKAYVWFLYIALIYIILKKYFLKTLKDLSLTNNSRII